MDYFVDVPVGPDEHQFVINDIDGGERYLVQHGIRHRDHSGYLHMSPATFDTEADAREYVENMTEFLQSAEAHREAVVEGNPDGIGDEIANYEIVETDGGYRVSKDGEPVSGSVFSRYGVAVNELRLWSTGYYDRYPPGEAAVVEGNPDGIANFEIVERDGGYTVNGFTFQTHEIAEAYVEGYQESADKALGAIAAAVRKGGDPTFTEAAIADGNPDGIDPVHTFAADPQDEHDGPTGDPIIDEIIETGEDIEIVRSDDSTLISWTEDGERHTILIDEAGALTHWGSIVDGNPGGEPLHESLSRVATQVAYEAEVVAAAAEEVDDPDIADAAEDQAEAMDDAAEALAEAADVAAETAAEVFTETGIPTVEVAQTETPEGEVISGEPPAADIPPESNHWYKRKIGA